MSASNHVFVTGGTGLVGRAVVERLLGRGFDVTLLIRAGAVERRSDELAMLERTAQAGSGSLTTVIGDLSQPRLELTEDGVRALAEAAHCFHIAALYDIEARTDALRATNVAGTIHIARPPI